MTQTSWALKKPGRLTESGGGLFTSALKATIVGVVAGVVAQFQTEALWGLWYSRFPLRGYEAAMKSGAVEPHFNNTHPSLVVAALILALAAFLLLRRVTNLGQRLLQAALICFGSSLTLFFLGLRFRSVRESNFLPLMIPYVVVFAGVCVAVGWLISALAHRRKLEAESSTSPAR